MSTKPVAQLAGESHAITRATASPEIFLPEDSFRIADVWRILRRHFMLFLVTFGLIVAIGMLYIFGSHKKYGSQMELLVQNGRGENIVSAGRQEVPAAVMEVTEEQLNSEAEVLQSADVIDEVADPGWSAVPLSSRTQDQIRQHEVAVNNIRKSLRVLPVRKSHLLTAEVVAGSPYAATGRLTRLTTAFLQKKREIAHPAGASQMFAQQAEIYRSKWDAADRALANFKEQNKIVSISDQEQLLDKQILSLDSELRETNVGISESQQKVDGDRIQLATIPRRRSTHETSIPATGTIDQLNTKLNELTLRRTELLTKYRADDRLVKQVDDQIHQIQAALSDSRTLYASESSSDISPTWQATEQDLSQTQAHLIALQGRKTALEKQVADLTTKLAQTQGGSERFNQLQHQATELEENYKVYAQKRDDARMNEVMDEHELLNVVVVQQPTFSLSPVRPRPVTDGVLTAITAFFIASFAVFLAHNSRSSIESEQELSAISTRPIFATVPFTKQLVHPEQS